MVHMVGTRIQEILQSRVIFQIGEDHVVGLQMTCGDQTIKIGQGVMGCAQASDSIPFLGKVFREMGARKAGDPGNYDVHVTIIFRRSTGRRGYIQHVQVYTLVFHDSAMPRALRELLQPISGWVSSTDGG